MKINGNRLVQELGSLGKIGFSPGKGVTRLAFTPADTEARAYVSRRMAEAGMEVRTDPLGNIIGVYNPARASGPAIAIGSHIDTVPEGGQYDGALGVLAGIEVVRTLRDAEFQPRHPLWVVSFADEEGARFGTGLMGSRAIIGELDVEELKAATDLDGITAYQAMQEVKLNPNEIGQVRWREGDLRAYLELHIEQGGMLESHQESIGIVEGIVGICRFDVTYVGRPNHAGTTPMGLRRDALVAAAQAVLAVREAATDAGDENTVATVGFLQVVPGAVNVVPGLVRFSVEIRDIQQETIERVAHETVARLTAIARQSRVEVSFSTRRLVPPVVLNQTLTDYLEEATQRVGLKYRRMVSGAGHDAMSVSAVAPAAMLFVPSQRGISHSPEEYTAPDDCAAGAQVLLETVVSLDSQE